MNTVYQNLQAKKSQPRRVLVTELEHVVPIRNGRIAEPLPPGRHRLSRRRDRIWVESSTPQALIVPSQEILTSDGATVRVTVSTVIRIVAPVVTVRAGEWRGRWYLAVQQAVRLAVTGTGLEELVESRTGLDERLHEALTAAATDLGLSLEEVAGEGSRSYRRTSHPARAGGRRPSRRQGGAGARPRRDCGPS